MYLGLDWSCMSTDKLLLTVNLIRVSYFNSSVSVCGWTASDDGVYTNHIPYPVSDCRLGSWLGGMSGMVKSC